ncbi:MAG: 50S ribosomal protein L13 [Chlamydiia bacterium]
MAQRTKTALLTSEQAIARRQWFLFDASGKTLGRFAAEITKVLRGKHRPDFTPHIDGGDGVIIINADKIHVTGTKEANKFYFHYSGYVGGASRTALRTIRERKPTYILEHAVRGMMPKSRLGKQQLRRLRIYAGDVHDLQAQQPIAVN